MEIDDAYLGGEHRGGKPGRGSPNKVPFVAAVQTTEAGAPVLVCFSKRPFTKASIEEFAADSLVAPATLVSDGLGCFTAVQGTAILHEPHVTGGGAACVKLPQFLAINTVLGNLKTAFAGTYHASDFPSTPIATSLRFSICSTGGSISARSSFAWSAPLA